MKRNSSKIAENSAKKHSGFTLVELVVVIAVLAILAGVGAVAYKGYIDYAKKSNDQVLLSAANEAFAASCEDHRIDRSALPTLGATLTGDGNTNYKTINGVGTVSGATDLEGFQKSFSTYFSGNENTELQHYKTYQILYDGEAHMFTFNDTGNANQALADLLKASGHSVESLSTPGKSLNAFVDLLLAGTRHGNDATDKEKFQDAILAGFLNAGKDKPLDEKVDAFCKALEFNSDYSLDADYVNSIKKSLKDLGLKDNASYNEMINGIIMCAAKETVSGSVNTDELIDAVLTGNKEGIKGHEIAAFPMIMAKMAGYYNYDNVSSNFKTYYAEMFSIYGDWGASGSKILETFNDFGKEALANDETNYEKYCSSGQAKKDMQGYLAAMQLLAANSDKVDLSNSNAFGSGDFAAFMSELLK